MFLDISKLVKCQITPVTSGYPTLHFLKISRFSIGTKPKLILFCTTQVPPHFRQLDGMIGIANLN